MWWRNRSLFSQSVFSCVLMPFIEKKPQLLYGNVEDDYETLVWLAVNVGLSSIVHLTSIYWEKVVH